MDTLPILYSFRRCPYAMRARLTLFAAGKAFEWREVLLRNKPAEFLKVSSDGTVPVLQIGDKVIQESLEILLWALAESALASRYDPELIAHNDGPFKTALDQYKYASRYGEEAGLAARAKGAEFMNLLDQRLKGRAFLHGEDIGASDLAILPFVRQFAHVDQDWFYAQGFSHVISWLNAFKSSILFESAMIKMSPWQTEDTPKIFGRV